MKRPLSLPIQLPMFNAACLREIRELCVALKEPKNTNLLMNEEVFTKSQKKITALFNGQSSSIFPSIKSADYSGDPRTHFRLIPSEITLIAPSPVATTVTISKRFSTSLLGLSAALLGIVATFCIRLWLIDGGHFLLVDRTEVLPLILVVQTGTPMALEAQPARFPAGSTFDTFKTNTPSSEWAADATKNGEMSCGKFQGPIATVAPTLAAQDGSLIDVMGAAGQFVCIKDSRGKSFHYAFPSSSGRSFYGTPPWLIESPNLGSMQVYFQGFLVRLPQIDNVRIRLIQSNNV